MRPLFLFDFDGVLADSLDIFSVIVRESLVRLGYNFIRNIDDFLELFDDNLYSSLAGKGVPGDDMIKLFAFIEDRTDFSKIRLYKGIKETLLDIKKIADIAIVSSNREVQIEKILEHNGALGLFGLILGVGSGTSKVDKIRMARDSFKTATKNTYYVVDTVGDLKETIKSGVNSVAVGWGWHDREKLSRFRPDHFVNTPDELFKLAEGICLRPS